MKKILDVINVGQGDCFILHVDSTCKYNSYDLIIDVGTLKNDITKHVGNNAKIMITHGHEDHINGFQYFTGSDFEKVDELILPLHFNEVLIIAKMLMAIKGFKTSPYCKDLYKALDDTLRECYILGKSKKNFKITYVYEDVNLCNHIQILNPPKPIYEEVDLYDDVIKDDYKLIKDLFNEEDVANVIMLLDIIYRKIIFNENWLSDFPNIVDSFNLYSDSYPENYTGM